MLALIDGDCLKYACGFASDANARAMGEPHEDLSFCLQGVKKTIESILKNAEADEYVIILSNKGSYRTDAFPEYKANRDPAHKPVWFKEIHDYLVEKHHAVFSEEGDEADDALGIAQCSGMYGDTIICTLDKDLDMIPGLHYNFSKNRKAHGIYHITEEEGDRLFYKQLITGDSTDNIPGIYKKFGKKATKKILAPIDSMVSVDAMYEYVLDVYERDKEWVDAMAQLIWIKRTNDKWEAP